MKNKARIAGHPIHPMLVSIPIGLWVFSFIADLLYFFLNSPLWAVIASYLIAAGCVGALLTALPGFVDYMSLKDPQTKKVATWHMAINLILVALYAFNFYLRYEYQYDIRGIPFALSFLGIVFLGLSGWLGGELIYVHKVGIDEKVQESRITPKMENL